MPETCRLKAENVAYLSLLLFIILAYINAFIKITSSYHPVWSDEFMYFLNAASFFENHTLQAAITYSGKGSELLGADAHGPGYPLLHGIIAVLCGWHSRNIILFNLVAILAAVWVIISAKHTLKNNRLKIICLLLLFPAILLYAVTYMQEMVHLPVAVVLSMVIWRVYHEENNLRYFGLFIALVLVAGLFRGLWFFWLIGLVPAAKSRGQVIILLLIMLSGVVWSFYYARLFNEPYPNTMTGFLSLLHNGHFWSALVWLTKHFFLNVTLYLSIRHQEIYYIFMKLSISLLAVFFAVRACRYQGRLDAALASIAAVNLLLLLLAHDAHSWREIRTMAPLFYFLLPFFFLQTRPLVHHLAAGLSFIMFCLALPTLSQWIAERNATSISMSNRLSAMRDLARAIPDNKVVLIGFPVRDNSRDLLDLPLRNSCGHQVKYIVQYCIVPTAKYDYILYRPHSPDNRPVVIANDYYKLVRN